MNTTDKLAEALRELQGVIAKGGITRLSDSETIRQAIEALATHEAAAQAPAHCDCGKKPAAECEKWEPGCDLGESAEHASVAGLHPARFTATASFDPASIKSVQLGGEAEARIWRDIDRKAAQLEDQAAGQELPPLPLVTVSAECPAWNAEQMHAYARAAVSAALAQRRDPLTDERILMIGRRALDKCTGTDAQHIYIARAIERAHGISASGGEVQG